MCKGQFHYPSIFHNHPLQVWYLILPVFPHPHLHLVNPLPIWYLMLLAFTHLQFTSTLFASHFTCPQKFVDSLCTCSFVHTIVLALYSPFSSSSVMVLVVYKGPLFRCCYTYMCVVRIFQDHILLVSSSTIIFQHLCHHNPIRSLLSISLIDPSSNQSSAQGVSFLQLDSIKSSSISHPWQKVFVKLVLAFIHFFLCLSFQRAFVLFPLGRHDPSYHCVLGITRLGV